MGKADRVTAQLELLVIFELENDMPKPTLWVMKTTCKHCGKVHQVKGLRYGLIEALDKLMDKCAAGESVPVIDIRL